MFRIQKSSLIFSLLMIAAIAAAAPLKKPTPQITWEKIPGAAYYLVEIKDEKEKIILRKQTAAAYYYHPNLQVGNYQVRITGYKKGNISIGDSSWFDLKIQKRMKPIVKSVSPDKVAGDDSVKIEVTGADFSPECKVFVKKGNITNLIDPIEVKSESKIVFEFTTTEFKPGAYILLVQNPGGKMSDPKILTITAHQAPAEKGRQKDGLANLGGLYFGIGYHYSYVLPEWNGKIQNSYLGVSVILSYTLKSSSRAAGIPFIRNIGFDFIGAYTLYPDKSAGGISDPKIQTGSTGLGIHFAGNFKTPVDFIIRFKGGFAFSIMKKIQNDSTSMLSSIDGFCGGELAIRYPFKNYFFLVIGLDFTDILYIEKQLLSCNPFFRIGLRF